ncbi:hypothetical protein Dsin_016043 [Dipteronia sinensis]|uniref:Uncharacterized protein n=1 Tax=Dipteronia sinensis TaxID=43782 RepID=A0AAE0ADK8_9ROSI|nr:hypothetical protein Dsin_016043 [Dipteronia sinensis]
MVSSEDFSFPKMSYSLPKFAVSPSLWRVCTSQQVYPHEDCCDENDQVSDYDDRDIDEEKMDMLWEEYFIQEQKRVSFSIDQMIKKETVAIKLSDSDHDVCDCGSSGVEVSNSVRGGLKMSHSSTACVNSKSRVAMIKVFKKIFLINSLARIKKNV